MRLLHKWTEKRIVKTMSRLRELIPSSDWKHIMSLLGKVYFSEETPQDYEALTGVSQDSKYFVVFFFPHLWHTSTNRLLEIVAHEFAHVLLGHCYIDKSRLQTEEEVHNQLEAWGFEDKDFELMYQFLKEHPEI